MKQLFYDDNTKLAGRPLVFLIGVLLFSKENIFSIVAAMDKPATTLVHLLDVRNRSASSNATTEVMSQRLYVCTVWFIYGYGSYLRLAIAYVITREQWVNRRYTARPVHSTQDSDLWNNYSTLSVSGLRHCGKHMVGQTRARGCIAECKIFRIFGPVSLTHSNIWNYLPRSV